MKRYFTRIEVIFISFLMALMVHSLPHEVQTLGQFSQYMFVMALVLCAVLYNKE